MFGKLFGISIMVGAMALTACGAGGGAANGGLYSGTPPAPPPSSNVPVQQTVAGQPAFVNPTSHHTLYFLDVDTATGGGCTGSCLSVWLPIVPSSGAAAQGGFTIIARSDGSGMQWAYRDHPLYMYGGDSGPDQANGNGIPFGGGHWHVARPTN
ncbi:MAG: hypothetical protein JO092_04795 [Candidatus Eremiobacteraeota bacterium]|nr:hypothetical protein [Candidatus Eremiobacteraeota bacterium]